MRRFWFVLPVLGALCASPLMPNQANSVVATTKVNVTAASWTNLGVGPLLVTAYGAVVYAIGDSTPSLTPGVAGQGFPLPQNISLTINTASNIYVAAATATAAYVIVSPILAKSHGGGTPVVGGLLLANAVDPVFLVNGSSGVCTSGGGC